VNKKLEAKLKELPRTPGVYFHKSASGEIIYVGKAAVLKNRVKQYFQSSRNFDIKTLALIREIDDTDWVETESEIDALFLESEMVKRYNGQALYAALQHIAARRQKPAVRAHRHEKRVAVRLLHQKPGGRRR